MFSLKFIHAWCCANTPGLKNQLSAWLTTVIPINHPHSVVASCYQWNVTWSAPTRVSAVNWGNLRVKFGWNQDCYKSPFSSSDLSNNFSILFGKQGFPASFMWNWEKVNIWIHWQSCSQTQGFDCCSTSMQAIGKGLHCFHSPVILPPWLQTGHVLGEQASHL